MKVSYKINILFFLVASLSGFNPAFVQANVLIQQQHLTYKGAFRVPRGNLGGDSKILSMGPSAGRGITYNSANNSLILAGSNVEKLAIEISIPTPVNSNSISNLNTAAVVQAPGNVANSMWNNLEADGSSTANGGRVGAFLVYNNKLIGNVYAYYAGDTSGYVSHFTSSLKWSSTGSNFSGFKKVGVNPISSVAANGGWVGGYMCHVPSDWQAKLGYPALTGNGAIPIIGRSSMGPSIWGFNPEDIGVIEPAPATVYTGYTATHPTLGTYGAGTLQYNMATILAGIAFPSGSDSILVFGGHGLGEDGQGMGCYGQGTSDPSLHRMPFGGTIYCYDPADKDKGTHAYPYVYQVWAYNANDFLNVKNGTKKYWEIVPYTYWTFTLPFETGKKVLGGVAYDPTTQRLFVSQVGSDYLANQYEPNPIIHVFSINTTADKNYTIPIILNIK
ncbi:MAG: hypothetical protein PHI97_26380 [Desulfobulbus sp.]|nr:hypothetical protein [Desulfobulbus sp.]